MTPQRRAHRLRTIVDLGRTVHGLFRRNQRRRYGFYEPRFFAFRGRQRFTVLQLKKWLNEFLNDQHWHALANDKLAFDFMLRGLGLPVPALYAVYHAVGRHCGSVPCLSDPERLAEFLRNEMTYPFFCKPVWGSFGRHATLVSTLDSNSDRLVLDDGTLQSIDDFVRFVTSGPYGNHLMFQELLRPHSATEASCGRALTTMRIIVVLFKEGPEIVSARWRIPTGSNVTDNFAHGSTGNLLGFLDLASGVVTRILAGQGKHIVETRVHPLTGKRLVDTALPDWALVQDLCLNAATAFPGLRLQHWDVALTDSGPVLLEVNALGDMSLGELLSDEVETIGRARG